jgi:hypothetical protein
LALHFAACGPLNWEALLRCFCSASTVEYNRSSSSSAICLIAVRKILGKIYRPGGIVSVALPVPGCGEAEVGDELRSRPDDGGDGSGSDELFGATTMRQ